MDADKVTVHELAGLLREARELGLTFDIGNAYIRRDYITKQDALRARIADALKRLPPCACGCTAVPVLPHVQE